MWFDKRMQRLIRVKVKVNVNNNTVSIKHLPLLTYFPPFCPWWTSETQRLSIFQYIPLPWEEQHINQWWIINVSLRAAVESRKNVCRFQFVFVENSQAWCLYVKASGVWEFNKPMTAGISTEHTSETLGLIILSKVKSAWTMLPNPIQT